jgi:hypothetical protein
MGFRGSHEQNPSRVRIRNNDGTVNIHCRKCGCFICKMNFTGIYTSLCHYCYTGDLRPLSAQEELLQNLYPDDQGTIEQLSKPKKKFNILDLMINTFQAIGVGSKKEKQIDQDVVKYPTADNETSRAVAKRKRREPIFNFNKKESK